MKSECDYCPTKEIITTELDSGGNEIQVSNLCEIGVDTICPKCKADKVYITKFTPIPNPVSSSGPININEVLTRSREIDNRVTVRTDIFNSATVAIVELKKAIDADITITNKPYALAETLTERFTHFKQVIFELNEKVIEASNNQKAIQIYLNNLANQLRADERAKLKIADINYQPKPIKVGNKSLTKKSITLGKKKLDKAELRKYAGMLGVAEFTLQMIAIQKNLSVVDAYVVMKSMIDSVKSTEVK